MKSELFFLNGHDYSRNCAKFINVCAKISFSDYVNTFQLVENGGQIILLKGSSLFGRNNEKFVIVCANCSHYYKIQFSTTMGGNYQLCPSLSKSLYFFEGKCTKSLPILTADTSSI